MKRIRISHEQARRYLRSESDGLLDGRQREALHDHLHECEACREESARLDALHGALRKTFRARWDLIEAPASAVVATLTAPEPVLPRLGRLAANTLLFGLWVWLYRAVFGYLSIIFTREDFRTNQVLLAVVLLLFFVQFRRQHLRPAFDVLPQLFWPGITLMVLGTAGYLLSERFLDINTLSASFFGLATYGLVGLWMSPRRWLASLPPALLLVGTLPFGEHLQTFVGYPMRIATARIVQQGMQAAGITSINTDSILVLESGLAQVDIPCSGIKSLWTGMLFLTAATWIEGRRIDRGWFGIAALVAGLLFAANVIRVAVLVLVGPVAGFNLLLDLVHVPLGVLAFTIVCGLTLLLVRKQRVSGSPVRREKPSRDEMAGSPSAARSRPAMLVPLLAAGIAGMALLYAPRPQPALAQSAMNWVFPAGMQVEADPLSPELFDWVTQDGAQFADRWRFTWQGEAGAVEGSMLFLTSTTWRGQHRPERCFEVQGVSIESKQAVYFDPTFSAQMLQVSSGFNRATALYWLQNGDRATDDFAVRIWSDLDSDPQPWVLVTVVLDRAYGPDSPEVRAIAEMLRASVAESLQGDQP